MRVIMISREFGEDELTSIGNHATVLSITERERSEVR